MMDNLQKVLLQKQEELEQLIGKIRESLLNVPEGRLRISYCKDAVQYYQCLDDEAKRAGHYIRKKDQKLAYELAQKEYDYSLLAIAEKNLKNIKRFLKHYQANELQQIYEKLSRDKKQLIEPRAMSDEKYAENWMKEEYKQKQFAEGAAEIYTERGERVRSKSEKIIADMLNKRNIFYKYECPIELRGVGIIHPDFTVLDKKSRKEIYWEHMGMMDNGEYCENALRRIDAYVKNGIMPGDRLLITYETSKHPLDTRIVDQILRMITD